MQNTRYRTPYLSTIELVLFLGYQLTIWTVYVFYSIPSSRVGRTNKIIHARIFHLHMQLPSCCRIDSDTLFMWTIQLNEASNARLHKNSRLSQTSQPRRKTESIVILQWYLINISFASSPSKPQSFFLGNCHFALSIILV